MDLTQSVINGLIRQGTEVPFKLHTSDIEVHQTRHQPKCATSVIMDMSGSMRYDGQYVNVKRMALALQGLIQSEYPGDFLPVRRNVYIRKAQARGKFWSSCLSQLQFTIRGFNCGRI